jgi:hypothetical protein
MDDQTRIITSIDDQESAALNPEPDPEHLFAVIDPNY